MCTVCSGYTHYDCPCCSESYTLVRCDACGGWGKTFWACDNETGDVFQVTEAKFLSLPGEDENARITQYCEEHCEECDGCGEVEKGHYYQNDAPDYKVALENGDKF